VGELTLLGSIGYIHLERGEVETGLAWFQQQHSLARELQVLRMESTALSGLGNAYEMLGDIERALELDVQALAIADELGEEDRQAEVGGYIGSLYMKMGRPDDALPYLRRALEMAVRLKYVKLESFAHKLLSELYETLGDLPASYGHYRRYIAVQEELQGHIKQQEIGRIRMEYERKATEQEKQLLRLQAEQLRQEMEHKANQLMSLTTNLIQKRESLEKIREELRPIARGTGDARQLAGELLLKVERSLASEDDWQTFERQFHQTHQDFIRHLAESYPELTPTELKVCSLLKVNCSTKDVARILSISRHTVDGHRTAIRRKIGLAADANLTSFLAGL
jgi:DNA-binding CsgD family transcriptional regulator